MVFTITLWRLHTTLSQRAHFDLINTKRDFEYVPLHMKALQTDSHLHNPFQTFAIKPMKQMHKVTRDFKSFFFTTSPLGIKKSLSHHRQVDLS